MTVEIILKDKNGAVLVHHQSDAMHPTQYKTHPEKPLEDDGYQLYAVTYQPTVVLKASR